MSIAPQVPLLSVEGLRKSYAEVTVLDGVTFALEPGSIAALAGGNGVGKSTLLRCIAGLVRHEGLVRLDGAPPCSDPASRRRLAYVPQTVTLRDTSTVGETLALFAQLRGSEVATLELPDGFLPPPERRIGVLSGGQCQRVVLAAALLGSPRLLLLDEPAASLDDESRDVLWSLVSARAGEGAAALVATPHPPALAGVAERTITLDGGRVVDSGTLIGTRLRRSVS